METDPVHYFLTINFFITFLPMFVLAIIEDKVKTIPEYFCRDSTEVLIEQIDIKYANKVLLDVGLCICFYDFIEVEDPYVYPAEGSAHQKVKFRIVVFRPFVGEVIVGKVIGSSKEGVKVSLDFFDDILIPSYLLQSPSEYMPLTSKWAWKYDAEGGQEFLMGVGEKIRFRVRTINFTRVTTSAKGVQATTTSESKGIPVLSSLSSSSNEVASSNAAVHTRNNNLVNDGNNNSHEDIRPVRKRSSSIGLSGDDEIPSVMQIIGCANEDGLGLVDWWS